MSIDSKIDDLYRQPLTDFTASRNALAKTLAGDEAKRVRALPKPTVVPWAVNQVYWNARSIYTALLKSGEHLRKAQLAALEGRATDLRAASDAHRRAIAEAVKEAERLAAGAGSKPAPDALMRTFEALSLASAPPESPGRLTRELQPAGFEALAGVTPASVPRPALRGVPPKPAAAPSAPDPVQAKRIADAVKKREAEQRKKQEAARKKREAAERKRVAEVKKAEAALERARQQMQKAQFALSAARNKN